MTTVVHFRAPTPHRHHPRRIMAPHRWRGRPVDCVHLARCRTTPRPTPGRRDDRHPAPRADPVQRTPGDGNEPRTRRTDRHPGSPTSERTPQANSPPARPLSRRRAASDMTTQEHRSVSDHMYPIPSAALPGGASPKRRSRTRVRVAACRASVVRSSMTSRGTTSVWIEYVTCASSLARWAPRALSAEGVKRACGAWKGRVTPVNNGHSSPPVSPRKVARDLASCALTWCGT
jgi:hypothetical protein